MVASIALIRVQKNQYSSQSHKSRRLVLLQFQNGPRRPFAGQQGTMGRAVIFEDRVLTGKQQAAAYRLFEPLKLGD